MVPEGWILLDTPQALDQFRRDHYLNVYTTALELTGSPAEAHRMAAQVFLNVARRYANKAISRNCDMYLAAQVNLQYAQGQGQASLTDTVSITPESSAVSSVGQVRQPATDTAETTGFDSTASMATKPSVSGTKMSEGTVDFSDSGLARVGTAEVASSSAPLQFAATNIISTAGDVVSASTPGMPHAPIAAASAAMAHVASIPVGGNGAMATVAPPIQAYGSPAAPTMQVFSTPATPMAATNPALAATAVPAQTMVTILVSSSPATMPVSIGSIPSIYATAPAQYPVSMQPAITATDTSPAIETSKTPPLALHTNTAKAGEAVSPSSNTPEVIYNPADTEYWSPDSEGKSVASDSVPATEPEPYSMWEEEEPLDKPSMFLSIVNSLLTLAGIASFVYLLYRINLILKLF